MQRQGKWIEHYKTSSQENKQLPHVILACNCMLQTIQEELHYNVLHI